MLWGSIAAFLLFAGLFSGSRLMRQACARGLLTRLVRQGGVLDTREINPRALKNGFLDVGPELGITEISGFIVDPEVADSTVDASRERIRRVIALEGLIGSDEVARIRAFTPAAFAIDQMVEAREIAWVDGGLALGVMWPYR